VRLPLHRLGREPVGLGLGNALRLVLDRLRPDLVRGRVRVGLGLGVGRLVPDRHRADLVGVRLN